jgi:hypothetical protein
VNQTVDILCRARELYAAAPSHAKWSEAIEPNTYCAITAIRAAGGERWDEFTESARDALAEAMGAGPRCVALWNAEHSTAAVLAALDRAITAQRLIVPPLQHDERRLLVHAGQESLDRA